MVYFLEKTSPKIPAEREPRMPPSWRTEVNQPVALLDATTEGKLSLKRVMTRDCPSTPCWYPYSKPPNLSERKYQTLDRERKYPRGEESYDDKLWILQQPSPLILSSNLSADFNRNGTLARGHVAGIRDSAGCRMRYPGHRKMV